MTTAVIREQLVNYLKIADEKKIKAIYTMVEDEIKTTANNWDDDFFNELNKRSRKFEKGNYKTFTWEETKKNAQKNAQIKK